jgi:hypothetical protein
MPTVGSACAAFLLFTIGRYLIQRKDTRSEQRQNLLIARTTGLLIGAWPFIVVAFIVWLYPASIYDTSVFPIMLITAVLALAVGGLTLWDAIQAGHRLDLAPKPFTQIGVGTAALVIFAATALLLLLPGMNGWARDGLSLTILNNMMGDFDVAHSGLFMLRGGTRFYQGAFLRLVGGVAGVAVSWWLLRLSVGHHTLPLRRLSRQLVGVLLGLILIIAYSITLPAAAATSFTGTVQTQTGHMFMERGEPFNLPADYGGYQPLWPAEYYGTGEVPQPYPQRMIDGSIETFGISEEEAIAQLEDALSFENRISRMYRYHYAEPVGYFIAMLILSGLGWLGYVGMDALANQRAQRILEEDGYGTPRTG